MVVIWNTFSQTNCSDVSVGIFSSMKGLISRWDEDVSLKFDRVKL